MKDDEGEARRRFYVDPEAKPRDDARPHRYQPSPPPDEFDNEDRYHMGHQIGPCQFADRPLDEILEGLHDVRGKVRRPIRPKHKGFISSNMLEGHGKRFRLKKIFRDFFGRKKSDIQREIDKLRKELDET